MKTFLPIALACTLLVSCATPPPKPTARAPVDDPEIKAVVADGAATLENIRANEAERIKAKNADPIVPPGYEKRPVIYQEGGPAYEIVETSKTRRAREERERLAAGEAIIAQHPEWTPAVIDAARTGVLFVGLPPDAVEAFWGKNHTRYRSDGVGGSFETWDYAGLLTVYFENDHLVRWSR